MSIIGKAIKGTVTLIADGLVFVITKSTNAVDNKFGENEISQAVSEIGSSTVRVSETTLRTLADVVDGGIDAGVGYLSNNENKQNIGLDRMKVAGKDIVVGVEKGIICTYEAGAETTTSAVQAGRYYARGNKEQASQEFAKTKAHAKNLGKVVAVGLLAFGAIDLGNKSEEREESQ